MRMNYLIFLGHKILGLVILGSDNFLLLLYNDMVWKSGWAPVVEHARRVTSAQVGVKLFLIRVSFSDGNKGPCLALSLLHSQRLSEFLQLVTLIGSTWSFDLHLFTGPEDAGYILCVSLDDRVCFEHLELLDKFVRQECTKVCEWQMYRRGLLI